MTDNFELAKSILATEPWVRASLVLLVALIVAAVIRLVLTRVLAVLTHRTRTDVDDRIAHHLRGPISWSVIIAALGWLLADFEVAGPAGYVARGLLITTAALLWTTAAFRVGHVLLEEVAERVDTIKWVEPKTLPLFDMGLKLAVAGGFLYFVCIAWRIPLTSWLTSAGIVGIAVGFAAKDTLANLFSGFFIIADAPYKVGDFIILEQGLRGIVSEIGMRSTRLLTRDDIEVTVPNAVIGNGKIINETGGPNQKMRVRVKVEAAYGSDIDRVEEVLLSCVEGVEHVDLEPSPRVRLRELGGSGLLFELLAWIDEPVHRGRVLHQLNSRVYKAMAAAGLEIPYTKRDVYIKELPHGTALPA